MGRSPLDLFAYPETQVHSFVFGSLGWRQCPPGVRLASLISTPAMQLDFLLVEWQRRVAGCTQPTDVTIPTGGATY